MAFDKPTRNALAKMVGGCRRLLTEDIRTQIQAVYGLQPDGSALALDTLGHLDESGRETARELREWQQHLAATEIGTDAKRNATAFDRMAGETAFTVLNRLAALRMCEERGHVVECVRRGMESDGFQLYERLLNGALGTRPATYRFFLERMFEELAVDLGVLFAIDIPQSLIFPSELCLEQVLRELNAPEFAHLWKQDETIGWIYQYFNSKEEREAMREASAAPRNSRELAVRNQFFTPRYVVEFLVDNTLGRIWYEMREGNTALSEACRYLVRRPTEIFLKQGEAPPSSSDSDDGLSQEEILRQPVYITHRPKKDPRDLKILDPACGSGHFLLYAFDLLETIYEEGWADEHQVLSDVTGNTLRGTYPDMESLRKAKPELILRHNLHGIDIDLRACQIAALALWLRAQQSYQRLGFKSADRPRITRSNIVCAEPMPGEQGLLDKFLDDLQPRAIAQLVQAVFEKMKLAGEAGSLLQIENEIADAVSDAKTKWLAGPKPEQGILFADTARSQQGDSDLDFSGITNEAFWDRAEERIYAALRGYSEQAENGDGYQRRLFADDAARGFAFIDLCRKRFDVVTMNPPFGSGPVVGAHYLNTTYTVARADIGIAFVERGINLCAGTGTVGAITSRVLVANDGLEDWRLHRLISRGHLRCFIDLGFGVLDDAVVEAAAYTVSAAVNQSDSFFLRVLDERDKELAVSSFLLHGTRLKRTFEFWRQLAVFEHIPSKVLCYWLPLRFLKSLATTQRLDASGGNARHGLQTTDDYRFLRLAWETPPQQTGQGRKWVIFAKGGEYQPYWDDLHLAINWDKEGEELKSFVSAKSEHTLGVGGWSRWINAWDDYFKSGLTFPERTTSDFSPRILPSGCIFSATGEAIIFTNQSLAFTYLLGSYTRPFKTVVDAFVGSGDSSVPGSAAKHYRSGLINSIPVPGVVLEGISEEEAISVVDNARNEFTFDETSRHFIKCGLLASRSISLRENSALRSLEILSNAVNAIEVNHRIEPFVMGNLGFAIEDYSVIDAVIGPHPSDYKGSLTNADDSLLMELWSATESQLVSQAVARHGARRQVTKRSYLGDRRLELMSHLFEVSPTRVLESLRRLDLLGIELVKGETKRAVSYLVGVAMGRWDIRFATGEKASPELPAPFAPLPVCPPGMLQNAQGLPLTQSDADLLRGGTWDYPIVHPWDGILLDDPENANDIVSRVREVLGVIWAERAEAVGQEACEILGIKNVREYFRKQTLFFADHLKCYSKSRRQAPIYWPLSTASGSYTLWIYYHRLNDDTLFGAVNKYVKPKIEDTERNIRQFESDLAKALGREASKLRDALGEAITLLSELRDFRDELLRVAELPYKPNLNDGVLITAAPLWKLFRLPKWRKDLQECWKKLEAGDYFWAHLAYSIWPDRVRDVCKHDRAIAIAHGLEELCEVAVKPTKKKAAKKQKVEETVPGDEE